MEGPGQTLPVLLEMVGADVSISHYGGRIGGAGARRFAGPRTADVHDSGVLLRNLLIAYA